LDTIDAPMAHELVFDANERVKLLEGAIRAYVAEKLKEISWYADQGEEVMFAESRSLADAAFSVAEVAGAAGLQSIGEIARGIGAMVENLFTSGVWHTDALQLHIGALALINEDGSGTTAENAHILERLRAMREAVGVVE
jgi:hypothetical protein